MNRKNNIYELKLLEMAKAFFAQQNDDMMLDVLADQETRICMLELGINE